MNTPSISFLRCPFPFNPQELEDTRRLNAELQSCLFPGSKVFSVVQAVGRLQKESMAGDDRLRYANKRRFYYFCSEIPFKENCSHISELQKCSPKRDIDPLLLKSRLIFRVCKTGEKLSIVSQFVASQNFFRQKNFCQ